MQSDNWEQLTTGPELPRGLHPATATPGFQALDAFRIFGRLIVLSLSACLLYDYYFFLKDEAKLGRQCQKSGKLPFIPERTVSGKFKRTNRPGTDKFFYRVAMEKQKCQGH